MWRRYPSLRVSYFLYPAIYMSDQVNLKELSFFRASEEVDMSEVLNLASNILACGMWTAPIPVDKETEIVMDGNHRLHAATLLGLSHVPCYLLRYCSSRMTVLDHTSGEIFDTSIVYRTVLHEKGTLPHKSTCHLLSPPSPSARIALSMLRSIASTANKHAVNYQ